MMERRIVLPPTLPRVVGIPWTGVAAEHMAAHDGGADVCVLFFDDGVALVHFAALEIVRGSPGAERKHPFVEILTADTQRILHTLVGAGNETVQ